MDSLTYVADLNDSKTWGEEGPVSDKFLPLPFARFVH
jgi:hypothetical protein